MVKFRLIWSRQTQVISFLFEKPAPDRRFRDSHPKYSERWIKAADVLLFVAAAAAHSAVLLLEAGAPVPVRAHLGHIQLSKVEIDSITFHIFRPKVPKKIAFDPKLFVDVAANLSGRLSSQWISAHGPKLSQSLLETKATTFAESSGGLEDGRPWWEGRGHDRQSQVNLDVDTWREVGTKFVTLAKSCNSESVSWTQWTN